MLQVALNFLSLAWNISSAVVAPRLHDQLVPNATYAEIDYSKDVIRGLKDIGHNAEYIVGGLGIVQAVTSTVDGTGEKAIEAVCDPRKGGAPDGF